ncbi:MAG: GspE/PulE family protein [Actinomycetota bacterium]|nr:GspE/PulE family protein [Actinomycetota bacterium]
MASGGTKVRAPAHRRLGEILIESGALDDARLQRAIAAQKERGGRLGEVLLELGLVTPGELLRAIATQFGIEFVDLAARRIDLELVQLVPSGLARRHRALPVWSEDEVVVLAMANPADVLALDDMKAALRRPVRAVLADPDQILKALERSAHTDLKVEEALRAAVHDSGVATPAKAAPAARPAERSAIVDFIDLLLTKAVQERASDVHIEPHDGALRVRFRIDGVLADVLHPPLSLHAPLISRLKVMAEIDIAERRLPQDGRISLDVGGESVDIRVATIPTVHGESVVLRILRADEGRLSIGDLGFHPDNLKQWWQAYARPWGAALVTGPTGSGKTTTLYATLHELNDPGRNIVTVEDPVEYRLDGIKQVQVNVRAGLTFPRALRSFLRADPDVMLIGEIRDPETAKIAIEASLTGHLVLSTLHTNDAASAATRLVEMGVEPFLVASSLTGVMAQRLARRLCDSCKVGQLLGPAQADSVGVPVALREPDGSFPVWRGTGCERCSGSGYKGRVAIHELLTITPTVSELILRRAPAATIATAAVKEGMGSLRLDGLRKVRYAQTSLEELLRVIA